jgi:hypothetical protein
MRCARCDQIVFAEVLARTPDGRLVFGWCPACRDAEECVLVETTAVPLSVTGREPIVRRGRRWIRRARRLIGRPRSPATSRRLAAMGVAGLMTAWALILAFVGGFKLIASGDGKAPMLLAGSGVMAVVSLVVWVTVIGRTAGSAVVLKVVQVAAAIVAFGTLAWGILHHEPKKAPVIVVISAAALAVSWLARRVELKRRLGKKTQPQVTQLNTELGA